MIQEGIRIILPHSNSRSSTGFLLVPFAALLMRSVRRSRSGRTFAAPDRSLWGIGEKRPIVRR